MAEETQYTANTGIAVTSAANSNLNGTGTLYTVLTAAANGTLLKSVIIKSTGTTSQGAVRLFLDNGSGSVRLLYEVLIPENRSASIHPAFERKVDFNLTLQSGYILKVSTEAANSFNVIAEGLDWAYYGTSVRTDTTEFTANTGTNTISTANANLDGTGTLTAVYVTGSAATFKGSCIESITVKGSVTLTTPGMVRLFLYDGTNNRLFHEIFVPAVAASGTSEAFGETIVFENDFEIKSGWQIKASTEQAQTFSVTVEGKDWKYKP